MRKPSILIAVSLVVASLGCAQLLVTHSNGLFLYQDWVSTKLTLIKGVQDSDWFPKSLATLSGHRLHLGEWGGHNEVSYAGPLDPVEVSFKFQLGRQAYLIFEYNRTDAGFSGLRIANGSHFDHALLQVTMDGKFLSKKPVEIPRWGATWVGENELRARFGSDKVDFYLNGQLIATDPHAPLRPQKIAFRNNFGRADVWNIRIVQQGSAPVITQNFTENRHLFPLFATALLSLGALWLITALVLGEKANSLLLIFNLSLGLMAFGGTYFITEFPQKLPPILDIPWPTFRQNLNQFNIKIETEQQVVRRLGLTYKTGQDGHFRIVFLGSSQTWGAGSWRKDDAYPMLIGDRLNHDPAVRAYSHKPYETIDTGISGSIASIIVPHYMKDWVRFEPRLVLIDLGNNDTDPVPFAKWIEELAKFNSRKNIPTVFILEANDPECPAPNLQANHESMRRIAAQYKIPVFDLDSYMAKHLDDGIVWWDNVHTTPFGESLIARGLYPEILRELALIHARPSL